MPDQERKIRPLNGQNNLGGVYTADYIVGRFISCVSVSTRKQTLSGKCCYQGVGHGDFLRKC